MDQPGIVFYVGVGQGDARQEAIGGYQARSRAARLIHGLGFTPGEEDRPVAEFSGGWRMRVALAAVLFSQPDFLLLDEPTNYLDLEGALWLESYLAKYPHTVIIVSHDLNFALYLSDRVAMMHDGQVVAIGTPEEIKKSQNPLVRKFIYTTTKGIQGERD